jgi:hypothetical protein
MHFFALVGFGSKENISTAVRMKSPPPLLKYTYVTDKTLLSLLWGRGLYVDFTVMGYTVL